MSGAITRRELWSQPERWQALLKRIQSDDPLPDLTLQAYDEILLFGSGSSYYLALLLGELTEQTIGVRVRVLPSFELFSYEQRYLGLPNRGRRLGVGISRSGESSEALLAADVLANHDIELLAISCYEQSSLMQRATHRLSVPEGQEEGMVMLRSFSSMVLAYQLFLERQTSASSDTSSLSSLPTVGGRLLQAIPSGVKTLANRRNFQRFVMLGSGPFYPLALEAALKVQEMAIATTEAYHTLEYRHGPKSTAGSDTLVTLFALERPDGYDVDLLKDLKTYDITSLVIGERLERFQGVADLVIDLESGLGENDRLLLSLLPAQVLAFETALRLGQNPDTPQHLAPVVRF